MSAEQDQVGGSHYKGMKIQPMRYSMANGLNACQHTAIKYITRYKEKAGVEDLRKAIHCIELLIEFEQEGL
jgi:beta-N-acetylglucosaminidase